MSGSALAAVRDWGASRAGRTTQIVLAAAVVFAMQWRRGPAEVFLYDQVQYWGAPMALLTGGSAAEVGVLNIRGIYSAGMYTPPALVSLLLGPASAPWTVLVWNGLLAAALCVGVLPFLAGALVPGRLLPRVWVCSLLGGAVLSGFGPYPLMDVWSVAFALGGLLVLIRSTRWWTAILGGAALVVAANLRPSYLAPLLIAAAVLVITRIRPLAWAPLGAALALVPQVVLSHVAYGQISAVPVSTPFLMGVQSAQATYAVRYDTVAFADQHPQQWYCDPTYARLLQGDETATTPVGVLMSAASHLPQSLWFLGEKAAASLRWSTQTPFEPSPGGMGIMALFVIGVSAVGFVCLVTLAVKHWREAPRRRVSLALLGVWVGSVGTLVLSTPETRFALPLVLIGVIGIAAVPWRRPSSRRSLSTVLIAAAMAVALIALLVVLGRAGVAHPVPAGPLADLQACIALGSAIR